MKSAVAGTACQGLLVMGRPKGYPSVTMFDDLEGRGITDPATLRAMRKVPRDRFVPADLESSAYADQPLPIGHGQTISQPYMVAAMTELLRVGPDSVVLEVGAGSGYQAAVLAELVRHVYTVEIVQELAEIAEGRLIRLGYENVTVRVSDGYVGWPEHAPYDGIIVTAAAPHVPPPLVEQLKPGARLILPLGPPGGEQELVEVEKSVDGTVTQRTVMAVRFVPFTGPYGRTTQN